MRRPLPPVGTHLERKLLLAQLGQHLVLKDHFVALAYGRVSGGAVVAAAGPEALQRRRLRCADQHNCLGPARGPQMDCTKKPHTKRYD